MQFKLSKLNKTTCVKFITSLNCSDKQKNEIMTKMKAFFNWCIDEGYLASSPLDRVKKFKVTKCEMKFWVEDELKRFFKVIDNDIENGNLKEKELAFRTKVFTLISFTLGKRPGETRALTFPNFHPENKTIDIYHSINYDRKSKDFLASTKTYHSQRNVTATKKIFDIVESYKQFLETEMNYPVDNKTPIFFNYFTNKPYTDSTLRKEFYKYCDKAKVKKIRLYDLRHTHVATMMSEGVELYLISERLGHSDFSTTVNKYGHLTNETRKEVAKITDKYF